MRIGDWSSDVCSSDLRREAVADRLGRGDPFAGNDRVLDALQLAQVTSAGGDHQHVVADLALVGDHAAPAVEHLRDAAAVPSPLVALAEPRPRDGPHWADGRVGEEGWRRGRNWGA